MVQCGYSNVITILLNHGKSSFAIFCFSVYAFILCWYKVCSIITIIVPVYSSAIFTSNYGIISSHVDSTGCFLCCYEVENIINNSVKFLDLDRNMLVWVC